MLINLNFIQNIVTKAAKEVVGLTQNPGACLIVSGLGMTAVGAYGIAKSNAFEGIKNYFTGKKITKQKTKHNVTLCLLSVAVGMGCVVQGGLQLYLNGDKSQSSLEALGKVYYSVDKMIKIGGTIIGATKLYEFLNAKLFPVTENTVINKTNAIESQDATVTQASKQLTNLRKKAKKEKKDNKKKANVLGSIINRDVILDENYIPKSISKSEQINSNDPKEKAQTPIEPTISSAEGMTLLEQGEVDDFERDAVMIDENSLLLEQEEHDHFENDAVIVDNFSS